MKQKATTSDAGIFMLRLYEKEKFLLQRVAALEISEKFGNTFSTFSAAGNLEINKTVLTEFKKFSPNAIWDRRFKAWREKENEDPQNSRQTMYK